MAVHRWMQRHCGRVVVSTLPSTSLAGHPCNCENIDRLGRCAEHGEAGAFARRRVAYRSAQDWRAWILRRRTKRAAGWISPSGPTMIFVALIGTAGRKEMP